MSTEEDERYEFFLEMEEAVREHEEWLERKFYNGNEKSGSRILDSRDTKRRL